MLGLFGRLKDALLFTLELIKILLFIQFAGLFWTTVGILVFCILAYGWAQLPSISTSHDRVEYWEGHAR